MTTARPSGAPPAVLANLNPDAVTEPFWKAATEHRLVCQRCTSCGTHRLPPAPICRVCQSLEAEWIDLSGKATVYAFTVVRHPPVPQMAEAVPYVIAEVELAEAENLLLTTNIVNTDPDKVHVGMPVEVVWDETAPGVVIPRFQTST